MILGRARAGSGYGSLTPICPPVQEEEDDDKDETYGESKKKAGGGRKKKSAKVSVTSAGKKKLPPVAQMLSELRAAEIDVEKKIAKEKEHLDKLENTLKTEPPVVASVLKEMRDKIVPKGMGAKAGIQAINKFIGALEVSVSCIPLDPIALRCIPPSHFVHFSPFTLQMWAEYKKSSLVLEDAKAEMETRKEAYESAKAKEEEKTGEQPSSLGASNW